MSTQYNLPEAFKRVAPSAGLAVGLALLSQVDGLETNSESISTSPQVFNYLIQNAFAFGAGLSFFQGCRDFSEGLKEPVEDHINQPD